MFAVEEAQEPPGLVGRTSGRMSKVVRLHNVPVFFPVFLDLDASEK